MPPPREPAGAAVLRPAITQAITDAVMEELATQGYARLSMEGVARRAGVGKSALYRRWPSKVAMVADALAELSTPREPLLSTGDPRRDLRSLLQASLNWLHDPRIRAVLPDLIAESQHDARLADATATHISTPRRAWARRLFDDAPYRSCLSETQVDLLLDLAVAPWFWRLAHGRDVDSGTVEALIDLLLAGAPLAGAQGSPSAP